MSYPDIFGQSAVGSLLTSYTPSMSSEGPIFSSGSLINGSKKLWSDPMTQQEFQTIHRLPFGIPKNVIQDNTVENIKVHHTWTNQRGYGNIINAHLTLDGVISARVSPWNRLPPLSMPYSGPAQGTTAWGATNTYSN